MERDSKKLSDQFNKKYDTFFTNETNKNIEKSLYSLGVLLKSIHLKEKNIRPYNPKDYELTNEWDIDTWTKVTWGTDDVKDDDERIRDFDTAMESIPYYDYLISNAVKYNRPAWALFGLIGMMQGTLNQNQFEVRNKEDVFLKEDFLRCIKYLPIPFLEKHKNDLMYLFNYFDERNFKLVINSLEDISIDEN